MFSKLTPISSVSVINFEHVREKTEVNRNNDLKRVNVKSNKTVFSEAPLQNFKIFQDDHKIKNTDFYLTLLWVDCSGKMDGKNHHLGFCMLNVFGTLCKIPVIPSGYD